MREVLDIIQREYYTDKSLVLEKEIASVLEGIGYTVNRQYPVSDRGDGRRGRIDIICGNGGLYRYNLAIEIDWKSPRKKSIFKLLSLPDYIYKLIILRAPYHGKKIEGIEVISISCLKDGE